MSLAAVCSYTNDVARAAETCQAPRQAKIAAADKKRIMPRRLVHKPGNQFDPITVRLHVCMQTVSSPPGLTRFDAMFAAQPLERDH